MLAASIAEPPIVIAGAGLHGAALAYYLTLRGERPLLIDKSAVAAAASGKGGGFLARDWGSGPTTQLHRVSFALHEELASELDVKSYRKIPVLSVTPGKRTKKTNDICPWLDGDLADSRWMDKDGGAQVAPLELCTKLVDAAVAGGASLRIGSVEGLETEADPSSEAGVKVGAVTVDGESVACKAFVCTMGPWAACAQDWFKIPVPMTGIKSTSIVFKAKEGADVEPYALFCGEDDRFGTRPARCSTLQSHARCLDSLRASPGSVHHSQAATAWRGMRRHAPRSVPPQLGRGVPVRHRRLRVRRRRAAARWSVPARRGARRPGARRGRDQVLLDDVAAARRHAGRGAGVHAAVPARCAAVHGQGGGNDQRVHVGRP